MTQEEEEERGGEWVEFHVTASLSGLRAERGDESSSSYSSVWVALGFSSNPKMVGVVMVTIVTVKLGRILLK